MLTRTKVAVAAAVVLASASGALAQNFNGDGVPNNVYSGYSGQGYNYYGPGYNADVFGPQADDAGLATRHTRHHHHHQR
jgi:hypothetical protein